MSIWSIILLVLIGCVCVYEVISFILTIIKRKKMAQHKKKVEVNNVIKDGSEDIKTEE